MEFRSRAVVAESPIAGPQTVSQTRSSFAHKALRWLEMLGDVFERQTLLCVVMVVLLVLPLAVGEAFSHPLTNDEIYTVHIAQAPTFAQMLHLSREIDLHPPLHYLTERAALKLPAPRSLTARFPSILAELVSCFALFAYTRRRLGNLFALIAVEVFFFTLGIDFSWSNRPYAQWVAWLAVLLLARDWAVEEERPAWTVLVVLLAACGMVMTHFLGVVCLASFWVAELVGWRTSGRTDGWFWGALGLPAVFGAMSYYQIHHVSQNAFPETNLPSVQMAVNMYGGIAETTIFIVALSLFVTLIVFGGHLRTAAQTAEKPNAKVAGFMRGFSRQDFVVLGCLLLLPLALLVIASWLKLQFWVRYGAAAVPAFCALTAWVVAMRFPLSRIVAVLLLASSVGYVIDRMVTDFGQPGNAGQVQGGRLPIPLQSLDPALPIVAASPMTYVEMSDREAPEISRRVYYLTDRQGSMQYAHYTLFENEDKIRQLLGLPSQTSELKPFLAQHAQFYVVGSYASSEVWLLRKLAADGLTLRYLGKFQSTYDSDDLYLVTR